jgi:hypothetical protein
MITLRITDDLELVVNLVDGTIVLAQRDGDGAVVFDGGDLDAVISGLVLAALYLEGGTT